jgi:hypothetical protein
MTLGQKIGHQVRNPDDDQRFQQHSALLSGMVGELATIRETVDKWIQRGIVWDGTLQIDAAGAVQVTFQKAVPGIYVINNTAALLTVVAGPRASSAPTNGAGIHQIPNTGGTGVRINSKGATTWTFYGAANTFISCQFFDAVIVD